MKIIDKNNWLNYLRFVSKIPDLNVWHVSLLTAIVHLANEQNTNLVFVSRSILMKISHIHTKPTYHKYLKELQTKGLIKYTPSYHPGIRSLIEILSPES